LTPEWFERFKSPFEEEDAQYELIDKQTDWEKDREVSADHICDEHGKEPHVPN
jgi:hypothetical protein